jgi:hypothetical protein
MIHKLLKKVLPRRFHMSHRARQVILKHTGSRVFSGPFTGMRFASSRVPAKYLLGTYELELAPLITQLRKAAFDTIVDVGAEMGYYAVGLSLHHPAAHVVAFEAEEKLHASIRELARINRTEDQLQVQGLCTLQNLQISIETSRRCLVVMDCEGGEKDLLDPIAIPRLRDCTILVELHDFVFRDVAETLRNRFEDTHEIIEVWSKRRTIEDFPIVLERSFQNRLLQKYFISAMNEGRPEPMRWFFLAPQTFGM